MKDQLNIFTGTELKERGMEQAIQTANLFCENWSESAYEYLEGYCYLHKRFMTENVRMEAERSGITIPPSKRAWGSVITRAKKNGMIAHDGYSPVKNPLAHKTPTSVWRSLIY